MDQAERKENALIKTAVSFIFVSLEWIVDPLACFLTDNFYQFLVHTGSDFFKDCEEETGGDTEL